MSSLSRNLPTSAQKSAAPAQKLTRWDALFRLINVVLIAGSIAFAWWTFSFHKPNLPRRR